MKRNLLVVLAAVAILAMFSGSAMAHHGVAGYDMTKTITLHGTVAKFDWSNPHVVVYVDAKNDAAKCSTGPSSLPRRFIWCAPGGARMR